ncbi:uncharacterized protein LOC132791918 isoform X1 [Drosophila nasuta]|uniref:Uncharacterized protein LOC117567939 isoform X1 n=2 Tax=Drosophila albomicans TaxID=7291 RepID=A0A6P8WKE1_DROAB|nr:uncharacterized protein LOC117567939 isoform X1 [Drosophila albomicans]XP_060657026.1 uncharacterized protein LOC132791918 isoform X1 [Drosophila nasuta]
MGCNTSQELKTKDGAAIDAVSNGEPEPSAPQLELADGGGSKSSSNNHTNHAKSNSIISNGDAKSTAATATATATNGLDRSCDKTEITELNDDVEDEAKAATKIQAVFRGHKVRETMKKSETKTATNNGSAIAANAASAAAEAASSSAEPTKAELEAEFDPNDKELCHAALKIQSTFRGHLARKLVNKDAPEDEDIQEITKKVAEELDIDLTDPELNKAATKIQASFRGHKTRKDANPE